MSKRLIAMLVAMLMALSILAGCSKKDEKPADATTTENTENKDTTEPTDEKTDDTGKENGEHKEILYRITGGKVATLNPHTYQTSAESDVFKFTLGNFLKLTLNPETKNFEFTPDMAVGLPEKSEDGLTWTWTIRDDLQWPDGTPITSKDWEYSWKMLLDPKLKNHRGADTFFTGDIEVVNAKKYWTGYAEDNIKLQEQKKTQAELEAEKAEIDKMADGDEKTKKLDEWTKKNDEFEKKKINIDEKDLAEGGAKWEDVGFEFPDDHTVVLKLAYAVPEVDFWLTFTGGGPNSVIRKDLYEANMNADRTETQYGTAIDKLDSNGTYVLTKWERDQFREYVKNDKSPIKDIYTPDVVNERVVEDGNTRMQLFENGEIDATGIPQASYAKYEEDPRVVFTKSDSVWQMFINMTSDKPGKEFLTDINFRKAMYWGMDRNVIAKDIFKTAIPQPCIVADTRTIDPIKGTTYRETPEAKANYPENDGFDEAKAKEFFDKAYEKYGKQMVVELLYFDNSDAMKSIGEYLEQQYENLFGADKIDIQLRAIPWNNCYDKMQQGDYDMGFGAWTGGIFNPWSGMIVYTQKFGIKCDQFRNDEFDKLYDRTVKGDLIFKPEERLKALVEMEKMLLDNVPMVPMYQTEFAVLYSDRLHLLTDHWVPGVNYAPMQAKMDALEK